MYQTNKRMIRESLLIFALMLMLISSNNSALSQIVNDFQVNVVNENDESGGAIQDYADIAVDSSGNFIIVWEDHRSDLDIYAQRYSREGDPIGPNIRVNDDRSFRPQRYPAISANAKGDFIVTWRDERNGYPAVYAQLYQNDGIPSGKNFEVTDNKSTNIRRSEVCINDSGRFVIIWNDSREQYWDDDIYAQIFDKDGNPKGVNFKINDDIGENLQYNFSLNLMNSGNFIVVWVDDRDNQRGENIYAQRFLADGIPVGTNFMVNDTLVDNIRKHPTIAIDDTGQFVITWVENRNALDRIFGRGYLSDGKSTGNNFKISGDESYSNHRGPLIWTDLNNNYICVYRVGASAWYAQKLDLYGNISGEPQRISFNSGINQYLNPSIAISQNGHVIATWSDERNIDKDIFGQICLLDGTLIGENFKVNGDVGSGDQMQSSIAVDESGNYIITWIDYRNTHTNIYAQQFLSDGTALGNNFLINDEDNKAFYQTNSAIVADAEGNFIILSHTFGDYINGLYIQRFQNNGKKTGGPILVNDSPDAAAQNASIDMNSTGSFILVWEDRRNENNDVYIQRYQPDGTPLGENVQVNDDQNVWHFNPCVALTNNGQFVVGWEEYKSTVYGIYLQRFLNDGTAAGESFVVDEALAGSGSQPDIDSDSTGNFIVTWIYDDRDVYARIYLPDSKPNSEPFKVNENDGNNWCLSPQVSVREDSRFIVCWENLEIATHFSDIYAQCYAADGTPLGENFRVTSSDKRDQFMPGIKLWGNRIYNTWTDNRIDGTGYDIWCNILDWEETIMSKPFQSPQKFILQQNYPNPFNPKTTIDFDIPKTSEVKIEVYNVAGQKVQTLLNKQMSAGNHQVEFNAENLSSGIYFYHIQAGEFQDVKKMVLIK